MGCFVFLFFALCVFGFVIGSQRTVHNSQFDQMICVNPSCISSPFLFNRIFSSELLPSDLFINEQTLIMHLLWTPYCSGHWGHSSDVSVLVKLTVQGYW